MASHHLGKIVDVEPVVSLLIESLDSFDPRSCVQTTTGPFSFLVLLVFVILFVMFLLTALLVSARRVWPRGTDQAFPRIPRRRGEGRGVGSIAALCLVVEHGPLM